MKNNTGFISFFTIIAIITVLAVGSVAYYIGKSSNNIETTVQDIKINTPVSVDETSQKKEEDLNGKHIGYIKNIFSQNGDFYLTIDYIQWITSCQPNPQIGYCMNGFAIANNNPLLRTFKISNGAVITMQTYSHDPSGNFNYNEIITLSALQNLLSQSNTYWTTTIPFWIDLSNGMVNTITEQYIP